MAIFFINERYLDGEGLLYRADPRVKTLVALAFAFGITLVPVGHWLAFAGFGAFVVAAVLLSRVPPLTLLARSMLALPFVLVALPLVFTRDGETLFRLPLLGWTASVEGIEATSTILLKSWLAVLMAAVVMAVTRPVDMIRGLERMRVPRVIAGTTFFMYRYLFVIGEEGSRLMRARDARSGSVTDHVRAGGSIAWRGRVLGSMIGSLFIRSYERAERVYAAMQARGYDGKIRFATERSLVARDWSLLLAAGLCLLGLTAYARL